MPRLLQFFQDREQQPATDRVDADHLGEFQPQHPALFRQVLHLFELLDDAGIERARERNRGGHAGRCAWFFHRVRFEPGRRRGFELVGVVDREMIELFLVAGDLIQIEQHAPDDDRSAAQRVFRNRGLQHMLDHLGLVVGKQDRRFLDDGRSLGGRDGNCAAGLGGEQEFGGRTHGRQRRLERHGFPGIGLLRRDQCGTAAGIVAGPGVA